MTPPDKCPKCQAPLTQGYPDRFRCGSYISYSGFQEAGASGSCIMRQRDNLEVRVEDLEVALAESIKWIEELVDSGDAGFFPVESVEGYTSWKALLTHRKPTAQVADQREEARVKV